MAGRDITGGLPQFKYGPQLIQGAPADLTPFQRDTNVATQRIQAARAQQAAVIAAARGVHTGGPLGYWNDTGRQVEADAPAQQKLAYAIAAAREGVGDNPTAVVTDNAAADRKAVRGGSHMGTPAAKQAAANSVAATAASSPKVAPQQSLANFIRTYGNRTLGEMKVINDMMPAPTKRSADPLGDDYLALVQAEAESKYAAAMQQPAGQLRDKAIADMVETKFRRISNYRSRVDPITQLTAQSMIDGSQD